MHFRRSACVFRRSAERCIISARRHCVLCPYYQLPIEGLEVRDYVGLCEQRRLALRSYLFSCAALVLSILSAAICFGQLLVQYYNAFGSIPKVNAVWREEASFGSKR